MHHARRRSLLWLVALLMLWQQMALAAVICPDSAPVVAVGVAPTAHMGCVSRRHDQADHLLCAGNYAQGSMIQSDEQPPKVPGPLLPPLAPAMPVIASLPLANAALASAVSRHGNIPPRRLLFCSLLI